MRQVHQGLRAWMGNYLVVPNFETWPICLHIHIHYNICFWTTTPYTYIYVYKIIYTPGICILSLKTSKHGRFPIDCLCGLKGRYVQSSTIYISLSFCISVHTHLFMFAHILEYINMVIFEPLWQKASKPWKCPLSISHVQLQLVQLLNLHWGFPILWRHEAMRVLDPKFSSIVSYWKYQSVQLVI